MASDDGWAQLVCTTDPAADIVTISSDKFTIGRAKSCNLSIENNKMVSSNHCYIERDTERRVWIQDTSTNGTLVNLTEKLGSGKRMLLNHGDEIYVVYRKKDTSLNLAYLFQDLAELAREALDETEDDLDETQEYSSDTDTLLPGTCIAGSSSPRKRKTEELIETDNPDISPMKKCKTEEAPVAPPAGESDSLTISSPAQEEKKAPENKDMDVKAASETVEKQSCLDKSSEECGKKEDEKKKDAKGDSTDGRTEATHTAVDDGDDFAETLMCIICQELMHDCISLQPCMHAFCAGCYSDWMQRSQECPSCRMKVERINKNHIVNNLIEAYLKNHPEKKRPEEDIKELDAKNKITRDMLYPKSSRRPSDESESSMNSEDSEEDGSMSRSSSTVDTVYVGGGQLGPAMAGNLPIFTTLGTGAVYHAGQTIRPPQTVCRQCPNYVDTGAGGVGSTVGRVMAAAGNVVNRMLGIFTDQNNCGNDAASTSTGAAVAMAAGGDGGATAGTSTGGTGTADADEGVSDADMSDVKVMPTPPPYVCSPLQTHVLCVCCLQPMPDRRHIIHQHGIAAQNCVVCFRAFCHAYWGCRKADCLGCLGRLNEMNFGRRSLDNIILENQYESQVLRDYMDNKGMTVRMLLRECLQKFDSGQYICTDQARFNISSNSVVCYACGLKNFRDLAYQYRRDIPRDQLPDAVTGRPDCYWGKNCRTQKNKHLHAVRFNHICEQTRTS